MDFKAKTGEWSQTYYEELDLGRVSSFALSVAAPREGGVAPTYSTRFRRGEFELFAFLGIPIWRVLHGEQEYSYHSSLEVGQKIRYRTQFSDYHEKKGSKESLHFLIFETLIQDDLSEKLLVTSKTTIIVRGDLK